MCFRIGISIGRIRFGVRGLGCDLGYGALDMDEDVIWDRVRNVVRQVATSTRQATRECWVLVCSR